MPAGCRLRRFCAVASYKALFCFRSVSSRLSIYMGTSLDLKLYSAARSGDLNAAIDALSSGASVHYRDVWDHMTPLCIASYRGHARVVVVLLGKGASVMCRSRDGSTPLHYAAGFGHAAVCEVLRACGCAQPRAKNSRGETPIDWAISNQRSRVVEILEREMDADIYSEQRATRARLVIMLKQHLRLLRWRQRAAAKGVEQADSAGKRHPSAETARAEMLREAVKRERLVNWMGTGKI